MRGLEAWSTPRRSGTSGMYRPTHRHNMQRYVQVFTRTQTVYELLGICWEGDFGDANSALLIGA
jgi:hypothetical protein